MKVPKAQLVQAIRELADWIDSANIEGADVCQLGIDGWGDASIHLMPEAFLRRAHDVTGGEGHYRGFLESRVVVTCAHQEPPSVVQRLCESAGERQELGERVASEELLTEARGE